MRRFEIPNNRDIQSLIKKLKLIVESIDKQSNNHEENVYFDYEIHVLTGKINKNWSFIYCPCKKAVTAINKEFNCIQKNLNVNDLPKNFSCNSSLCKNYKKIEIRSLNNESGSDSDMDTANDPETFISKIDLDEF